MVAVSAAGLRYRYGGRLALEGLDLEVAPGEVFALLGPNGSGKTTFFRLLSTLLPVQEGRLQVLGIALPASGAALGRLRCALGVVFQSPSLDRQLTVVENLRCQGRLYGLRGAELRQRCRELLERFGLAGRAHDLVATLSGGLRRRVELAKALLHGPRLLVLDEPSTGLDPRARLVLWEDLRQQAAAGVTVVLTTHLLEEADKADRLAILHLGKLAAVGRPEELKAELGGQILTLRAEQPQAVAAYLEKELGVPPAAFNGMLRVQHPQAHRLAAQLCEAFPQGISWLAIGQPSLEDVFIARTGCRLTAADEADPVAASENHG
jgi:ABC-2 type transport system ATP-binding protein